jgi:hypothetical protein
VLAWLARVEMYHSGATTLAGDETRIAWTSLASLS